MRQIDDPQSADRQASAGHAAAPPLPVFLKLAGRDALVVGGGPVAAAKYAALRAAGARVTVVAPDIGPALLAHGTDGVTLHRRTFEPADLDGVWYVVAAAPPEVNRQVAEAAEARRVFVNAVDDPDVASAYAAAVVQRGELTLAVSTGGRAPALAGLLREALEELLPAHAGDWVALSSQLRESWKAARVGLPERRALLLEALWARHGLPGRAAKGAA